MWRSFAPAAALILACLVASPPAAADDWRRTPVATGTVANSVVRGQTAWLVDLSATSGFLATDACSCADSFVIWNADTSGTGGVASVDLQTCAATPAGAAANACGDYFTTPLDSTKSGAQEICGAVLRVLVNTPPAGGETPLLGYFCR